MSRQRLTGIARILIAVLLATLLSPSFGWEAAASHAAHGHDALLSSLHDGGGGHHQDDEDSHHHLGCAGHMLGHLPAQLGAACVSIAPDLSGEGLPEPASCFSSHITERPERPPAVAA